MPEVLLRSFFVLVSLLFNFNVLAKDKLQPSVFEVTPINSPVKGSTAKFSLILPQGFEVDKVKVKLVNANDLKKDHKKFEDISVTGNELNVGVSKLPPGFYRLYVKVWDKKNKSEHDFKTKFHDFVRFVIDESLQVPMPDSKKNNATLAGIDSDSDGIRDDIQRYINETYANKPNIKLAAKQIAIALQLLTTSAYDVASTTASMAKYDEAYACFAWVNRPEARTGYKKLNIMMVNTELRVKQDMASDQFFHGGSSPDSVVHLPFGQEHTLCDFPAQQEQ